MNMEIHDLLFHIAQMQLFTTVDNKSSAYKLTQMGKGYFPCQQVHHIEFNDWVVTNIAIPFDLLYYQIMFYNSTHETSIYSLLIDFQPITETPGPDLIEFIPKGGKINYKGQNMFFYQAAPVVDLILQKLLFKIAAQHDVSEKLLIPIVYSHMNFSGQTVKQFETQVLSDFWTNIHIYNKKQKETK